LKCLEYILLRIDPLLGNDSVNTFPHKQTRATIGRPLLGNGSVKQASLTREAVFSAWSVPRGYKGTQKMRPSRKLTRVEAGSNTSSVPLRVVGGDEKGSLKSETVKYGRKPQGTKTREDCAGKGQWHIQKTDPSSRQRGRPTESRT
jgi:hypothetical protein